LAPINQTLDEVLTEQEGNFDADSRWALAWLEQLGFAEGEYGMADTLYKAKNTSVDGLTKKGIVSSKGGQVRLLRPDELPELRDAATDPRLTAWEMVHHLIRVLEAGGETAAVGRLRAPAPRPERSARRRVRDPVQLRPGADRVGQAGRQLPAGHQPARLRYGRVAAHPAHGARPGAAPTLVTTTVIEPRRRTERRERNSSLSTP
jgi:hypothetical protein